MNENFILWIAAVAAVFTVYQFRSQILELVWKFYLHQATDEQLEKAVRLQYNVYEQDCRSFNAEGLDWLLEMSRYLSHIWKEKFYSTSMCLKSTYSEPARQNLEREKILNSAILEFWQNAEKQLTCEINRRRYFNS